MTWIAEHAPTCCHDFSTALDIRPNSASSILRRMHLLKWVEYNPKTGEYTPPGPGKWDPQERNVHPAEKPTPAAVV